jgi:hypothetical protein
MASLERFGPPGLPIGGDAAWNSDELAVNKQG